MNDIHHSLIDPQLLSSLGKLRPAQQFYALAAQTSHVVPRPLRPRGEFAARPICDTAQMAPGATLLSLPLVDEN